MTAGFGAAPGALARVLVAVAPAFGSCRLLLAKPAAAATSAAFGFTAAGEAVGTPATAISAPATGALAARVLAVALLVFAGAVGSTNDAEVPVSRPAATCVRTTNASTIGIIGVSMAGFSARPPTIARLLRFEGFAARGAAAAGSVLVFESAAGAVTSTMGVVATAPRLLPAGSVAADKPGCEPRLLRRSPLRLLSSRAVSSVCWSTTASTAPRGAGAEFSSAATDSVSMGRLPFFFLRFRLLRTDEPSVFCSDSVPDSAITAESSAFPATSSAFAEAAAAANSGTRATPRPRSFRRSGRGSRASGIVE